MSVCKLFFLSKISQQLLDFGSVVVGFLFIVTPIVGVCNCSMLCCRLLYVRSSIAIILMGKRELVALLGLSFWCLMMVEQLFLAVPRGYLQFVIVVFLDHTHLLFRILKFSIKLDSDELYCGTKITATYCLSVPLFVHFSFSPMKISVTDFSAPVGASVNRRKISLCRVPTSSGNHGKPRKSLKKSIAWKNHGI